MNQLESKCLKYLLLLVGVILLKNVTGIFIAFIPQWFDSKLSGNQFFYFFEASNGLINLVFALILYFDCKSNSQNKYIVPLLALFAPIVGTMFYFISEFLVQPQKSKS